MSESETMVQTGKRRRGRRWPILILLLLAGAALVVGGYFYLEYEAGKRLQAAIEAAERSDPNWRLEGEDPRAIIPDEKNSATVVTAAAALVPSGRDNFANTEFKDLPPHSAQAFTAKQM